MARWYYLDVSIYLLISTPGIAWFDLVLIASTVRSPATLSGVVQVAATGVARMLFYVPEAEGERPQITTAVVHHLR
jgi:hypothetical protein